jgi:hypothetical protein
LSIRIEDICLITGDQAVALANWAIEHNPDIDAHREAYDRSRPGT